MEKRDGTVKARRGATAGRRSSWICATLALIACQCALAVELGYSVVEHLERENVTQSARGIEGRVNFGGGRVGERYSGDRWSIAVGHVNERLPHMDEWIRVPSRHYRLGYLEAADSYQYVSFVHRWYTKRARFDWAPQLRLFVGTGVAWRNAETCVEKPMRACWTGTPGVSSRWVFHQTFGLKWRERAEVAYEHGSTGRISTLNFGDDLIRFTLYATIGGE